MITGIFSGNAYTNTTMKKEYGKWYLCLNIPKEKIETNKIEIPIFGSVFLDPGVRTFQTFYSPDGICGKLGENIKERISKIKEQYEKKRELKNKRISKRCDKLIAKAQNIVLDMHNQVARFLTTTFRNIFLPTFNVSDMVEKKGRKIGKTTTKDMLDLCHYKFKQKLSYMCKSAGVNYIEADEHLTSKTCGGCGYIHGNLGGSKVYLCEKCGLKIDRDLNAARNICQKNIVECGATPLKCL